MDIEGWTNEVPLMRKHLEKFGSKLPKGLEVELEQLAQRLQGTAARA